MPNWVSNTIRVRGEADEVAKFVERAGSTPSSWSDHTGEDKKPVLEEIQRKIEDFKRLNFQN